jgi:hypothetical protein
MIFIAYNLLKYKQHTIKNIEYKNFVIDKINLNFPNEEYLLPYSQYTRQELVNKLKCQSSDIKGTFRQDLIFLISKCNKLIFFPTDSCFIGSGVHLEISCARGNKLPVYGYNKSKDEFTQNFTLEKPDFFNLDPVLTSIFYKKVIF